MYGSRRGNASLRASLVAVLVGAVLAGGATMAGRLGDSQPPSSSPFSDVAVIQVTSPATATTVATQAVLTTTAHPTTTHPTTTTPPPLPVVTTTTTKAAPPPTQTQQVFALVNQARAQAGCKPLADDARLDTAAQAHSDDMSNRDYFSHTTPEGVTFDKREEAAGYPSPGGENIAAGQTSATSVMNAWMNSAGHRANILDCSFAAIGIGLNTHGWYWTQDFGR